jgi:hypothetical protein
MNINISPKLSEIIMMLIYKQNSQLIKIIEENEGVDLSKMIIPSYKIIQEHEKFILSKNVKSYSLDISSNASNSSKDF